ITGLSGAKHTVGYEGYRYSWLLNQRAPAPDVLLSRTTIHSVEQQLALLNWTGLTLSETRPGLRLQVAESARKLICERLHAIGMYSAESEKQPTTERFAIIAPAAAFEAKRWS